jgi:hypothetical protein
MREQKTGEDERPGEPADEYVHFHRMMMDLFEHIDNKHAEDATANGADPRIACERAHFRRAADELALRVPESAAHNDAIDQFQDFLLFRSGLSHGLPKGYKQLFPSAT